MYTSKGGTEIVGKPRIGRAFVWGIAAFGFVFVLLMVVMLAALGSVTRLVAS